MGPSARAVAEQASLQAFLTCYMLEVAAGEWLANSQTADPSLPRCSAPYLYLITLPGQQVRLAIEVAYYSATGRHRFGRIYQRQQGQYRWTELSPLHALGQLAQALYPNNSRVVPELRKARELEFLHRLTDSQQVMSRYVEQRRHDPRVHAADFLATEQAQLFGHGSHPTPKSRQGMTDWQQAAYAPEMAGQFQLHYFLVDRNWVEQDSTGPLTAEIMALSALTDGVDRPEVPADRVLMPAHPLQAQWLMLQPWVSDAMHSGAIESLGPRGPRFAATSSVRTLYNRDTDWMLKFSIPVKVTNSLRVNKLHELRAGVIMARLIDRSGFELAEPSFRIIQDPAYMTVRLPGQAESGFEVIFRNNPFTDGQDLGVTSIATLTQDPLPGYTSRLYNLIEGLALNEGRSLNAVCLDWFSQYLERAVAPALQLYDDHGIALEAHQQNSLLDVSGGYPSHYYYRDNQGYYLSESQRAHLLNLCPEVAALPELFYRDTMIRDRFCYYLVVNQLFGVIARFGRDRVVAESVLLQRTRRFLHGQLPKLNGPALPLVRMLLNDQRLPFKGNLLTRVHDVDELDAALELAVYTSVPNPLKSDAIALPSAQDTARAQGIGHGAA